MNKRKRWRLLSLFLILCMLMTSIPAMAFAGEKKDSGQKPKTDQDNVTYLDPKDVTKEDAILSASGKDYTTFSLGGDKRYTIVHAENVRFEDEEGTLVDYDPSLTASLEKKRAAELTGYAYTNASGDSKQYLPEMLSEDTPIFMEKGNYTLSMTPTEKTYKDFFGKKAKVKREKEKVKDPYQQKKEKPVKAEYKEETALAYLTYTSMNTGVKEDIVLTQRPAKNELQFEVKAEGMKPKYCKLDGSIGFYDQTTGEMVNQILPPNMNDASGKAYSEKAFYEIEEKEGEKDTYLLTLVIDKDYLKDEKRQYPVTIDPAASWTGDSQLRDVYVSSASPNTNYYTTARQSMPVGKGSSSTYRTYINFLNLKAAIEGGIVENAYLNMYENADSYSGRTVQGYRVTESWTAGGLTWNNKPPTAAEYTSSFTTTGVNGSEKYFNLRSFTRRIADGYSNYGLMMKVSNESVSSYAEFHGSRYTSASYRPELYIEYMAARHKPNITMPSLTIKRGQPVVINWNNLAANALTELDYVIKNKETGKVMNASGTYESLGILSPGASGQKVPNSASLPDGNYTITLRATYYNDSTVVSAPKEFSVDGTAPNILEFDHEDDGKGADFYWTVSDPNFQKTELYLNGKLMNTGTSASGHAYISVNALNGSGKNDIVLKAYDKVGNYSSRVIVLNFDREEPKVKHIEIEESESPMTRGWRKNPNPMIKLTGISDNETKDFTKENFTCCLGSEDAEPDASQYQKPSSVTLSKQSDGTYTAYLYLDRPISSQGSYVVYVKVSDEVGNASVNHVGINFDNEKPTGRISTKNNLEIGDSNVLHDNVQILGYVDWDAGSDPYRNEMELWKEENGQYVKLPDKVYNNFSAPNVGELDTRQHPNGKYMLKMLLEDEAGNTNAIEKKITIENRIGKPKLTAAASVKENLEISWTMPEGIDEISGIQYQVIGQGDGSWIDVPDSHMLSGTFTAVLPETEGAYKVSVRAVDVTGTSGMESTIPVRVDKTAPEAVISSAVQGLIQGSVSDLELAEWKVWLKEKEADDETYTLIQEGTDAQDSALLANLMLYDSKYPVNTWYTVKLTAADKAGNETTVTEDLYKDESYPAAEVIEPEFRIKRPEYLAYDHWKFTLPDSTETLSLTTEWYKEMVLSSADWFVGNEKAEEGTDTYSMKNADGSSKYETNQAYPIAAVARGPLGGAHYSMPLLKNAEVKELSFGTRTELEVKFDEAVSFTLAAGEENCNYYAKVSGGEYVPVTPGETVEMLTLDEQHLTADSITIKAEPADGLADKILISFDRLGKEAFELSGIEGYRPERLSAKDKVNYKTYLKWGIPENLPEDIYYQVYRSTEKGFDPELTEPLTEVRTGYYIEPNVDYETTFYYRVRAVRKDTDGKIIARSSISDQAVSTVVDANEFTKRLGEKEYWNYADFELPCGSGAIEKSEGNFVYAQTDAEMANEQLDVSLTRTYNSMATSKSAFGVGWNHNYDIELLTTEYSDNLEKGERLVMKDSSGTLFFFAKNPNGDGEYISSMGKYLKLRKLEDSEKKFTAELPDRTSGAESGKITINLEAEYVVETKDNLSYFFNEGGQLVYEEEPNGNFLLFAYDLNSGLLTKVTTSKNLSIDFAYNTQPGTDPLTVKTATLPDGSDISYSYSDGMLTSVVKHGAGGEGNLTYAYSYDGNEKLSRLSDGAGNFYNVECSAKGSVGRAEYPDGEKLVFTRNADHTETETTVEKDGYLLSKETAEFERYAGSCIRVTDADGMETMYSYRDGMLARTQGKTEYEVLENGNLLRKEAEQFSVTEYDETMNPVAEESSFGQWSETVEYEYSYDGEYIGDLPSHEESWCDDELVGSTDYAYDDYGNLISEEDLISGEETLYDYYTEDEAGVDSDFYGELESETQLVNDVVQTTTTYTYSYDAVGNKTVIETETTDHVVTVTTTKYDVMGRELESSTSIGGTVKYSSSYTYDRFGRVTKTVTTEGSVTTTTTSSYNGNGAVAEETTTVSDNGKTSTTKVSYEYDRMNRVVSQTTTADGRSRPETTTYTYSSADRNPLMGDFENVYAKITTTISGSTVTKTCEDGNGKVLYEDAGGIRTYFSYDKAGNRIAQAQISEGEGMTALAGALLSAYGYDQNGNQTVTLTDVTYDAETGAFVSGENTIKQTTSYDAQGRAVRSTDGKGIATTNTYDKEGRMASVVQDADGEAVKTTISYTEPAAGDNTSSVVVTLANGSRSKSVTSARGLTIKEADLGAGSETAIEKMYDYTDSGNVLKQTDSAGNYSRYAYDAADRVTAVNYFDKNGTQTLRTEYVYDVNGNVTTMSDYNFESGSKVLYRFTEKKYDGFGRMVSEAEVDCSGIQPTEAEISARRMTYSYDDDDRLTEVNYPAGFEGNVEGLTFTYGDYSRLLNINAVTESGIKTLREYVYDNHGKVTEIRDNRTALGGTGYTVKTYGYDRLERPTSMTITDSEKSETAEEYTYSYDVNSQIVKETKLNNYPQAKVDETWEYTYDALGRLLTTTVTDKASGNVKTEKAYTYDGAGNRLSETENGVTTENTYNGLNQMVKSGGNTYTYDANGNLTKESGSSLTKEYSYDARNQLDTATFTENGQVKLKQKNLYDGDGQRISKTEGNVTTRYSYQNGSVVYTDGAGENTALNILGDSGNIIASRRADGSVFYNKDMRESTTTILDQNGNSKASYQYSDFGETIADSDFYNEICYTGGIYDKNTGLYYLNARYYDPDDGRFLTEDTYRGNEENPNSLHLYAYCYNNPLNYVDPSGHLPWGRKLNIADYRTIHNKVADLVAWSLKGIREVYVKGSKGRGFLDVFIPKNFNYYEVKSKNASIKNSTKKQMRKYDAAQIPYHPRTLKRGTKNPKGTFYYGAWKVSYQKTERGLIAYTPIWSESRYQRAKKNAKIALVVAKISIVTISVVGSGGLSVPGYILAVA